MHPPSYEGIRAAAERLRPQLPITPAFRSEGLSQLLNAEVYIKLETLSPVGSFKLRGALNALQLLAKTAPLKGAITSSSGNHGLGVAHASRLLQIPCDIFLPDHPNPLKRDRIAALGATIHLGGHDLDAAKDSARAFATAEQRSFIDDGESLGVIEGAGCVGLELAEQTPPLDMVFIPTGSASLVSGCAIALHATQPECKVIAVQATGSPAMVESYHARRAVERPIDTCADGLVCRTPAKLALTTMLAHVDDAMLVSDEEILSATQSMIFDAQVLAEPSGSSSLAAAWKLRDRAAGKCIALIITGANITAEYLRSAMAAPPLRN